MNIYETISRFARKQRDEEKKAIKTEKHKVSINPDTYIAKEIMYQTALLHQIKHEIEEIKRDGNIKILPPEKTNQSLNGENLIKSDKRSNSISVH